MSFQKNSGAVKRFAQLMRFATWLQNIPNKLTPAPFRIIQIGSAFWQSRVLYVAVRLDIPTVLGDDSLHSDLIASRVSAQPEAIFRMMRLLAAMGIFEELSPKIFRNNKLSSCLRADHPKNVRSMVLMHNSPEMSEPWFKELEQGVRSGTIPFQAAHGSELFSYMNDHAEFDALFARAMDSVEAWTGDGFATDFDWGRFDRIIDVGGSNGSKSLAILKHHPHIKALVFDRASVVNSVMLHRNSKEQSELFTRLSFEAGDLFTAIPAAKSNKDIFFLCAVLHGMDDRECLKVLGNLTHAVGSTGARVALMELVVPGMKANLACASFDMQMFMGTRGKERTLDEWQKLFDQSGLILEEQVGVQSIGKILVLKTRK